MVKDSGARNRARYTARLLRGDAIPTATTAGLLLGALGLVYMLAVRTVWGQKLDAASLGYVTPWRRIIGGLAELANAWLPTMLAAAALGVGIAALWRKNWRRVLAALLTVAASSYLSQLLKISLPRPFLGAHGYVVNTFPSGHASATTALVIAILLLWPGGPPRGAVVTGAALVAFGASCTVLTYAHRASDPVGSILLAGAVSLVVTLALRVPLRPAAEVGYPVSPPRSARTTWRR